MHFLGFSEACLLILKELSGEYLAKCAHIFYFIIFSRFHAGKMRGLDREIDGLMGHTRAGFRADMKTQDCVAIWLVGYACA